MAKKKDKKSNREGSSQEDLMELEKQIKEEKDSNKKDKMKAKLNLASKMAARKNIPTHQTLQSIKTQERFDKDPISAQTDIIGDEMLSDKEGSFKKGGLARGMGKAIRGTKFKGVF